MKYALMMGFGLALTAGVASQVMAQDDMMMDNGTGTTAVPLDTTASDAILRNNTAPSSMTVSSTETHTSVAPVEGGYKVMQTQTTVKQVVVPGNAAAQPETLNEAVGPAPFDVIMPDGTKLQIAEEEWWKDPRLNGYTRFWFDTVANAYRPVVEKENKTYQKRENIWCTPEQSSAGKC